MGSLNSHKAEPDSSRQDVVVDGIKESSVAETQQKSFASWIGEALAPFNPFHKKSAVHEKEPSWDMLLNAVLNNDVDFVHRLLNGKSLERAKEWVNLYEDNPPWPDSLIIMAVKNRSPGMVQLLLQYGAATDPLPGRVVAQDGYGKTPLMWAVEYNVESIVDLLLSHGANLDAVDHGNKSVLAYAVDGGSAALVAKMLQFGARLSSVGKENRKTLLHWAVGQNQPAGHSESSLNNHYLIKLVLARMDNPNVTGRNGQTALHIAVANGNIELVKLLLEYRLDPHFPDYEGETPVDIARESKNTDMLDLLEKVTKPTIH